MDALKRAVSSCRLRVRSVAQWHCEVVKGEDWELQNARPWFENLWRLVLGAAGFGCACGGLVCLRVLERVRG